MKKTISLLLLLAMVLSLCACGTTSSAPKTTTKRSSSSYDYSYTPSTISKSTAISKAQSSKTVQNAIADKYGMKFYYTPDWGTCTATKSGDGWKVTLKGNISGYTDDYKSNFIYDKKFTATVTVSGTGYVSSYVSVSKY